MLLVEQSYCTVLPKTWNVRVVFLFSGCLKANKLLYHGQICLQAVSQSQFNPAKSISESLWIVSYCCNIATYQPIYPSIHVATVPSGPWPPSQDASIHPYSQLFSSILLSPAVVVHPSEYQPISGIFWSIIQFWDLCRKWRQGVGKRDGIGDFIRADIQFLISGRWHADRNDSAKQHACFLKWNCRFTHSWSQQGVVLYCWRND